MNDAVELIDYTLASKTKRHIVGGTLLSLSLMFGGLAITVMTIKTETRKKNTYYNGTYE